MRRTLFFLYALAVYILCVNADEYEPIKVKDFPESFVFLHLGPEEQEMIIMTLSERHTVRHKELFDAYQEGLHAPRQERLRRLIALEDALYRDLVWVRAAQQFWTEVLVLFIREAISTDKQHAVDLPEDHQEEQEDLPLFASVVEDFRSHAYVKYRELLRTAIRRRNEIQKSLDDLSIRARYSRNPIWHPER